MKRLFILVFALLLVLSSCGTSKSPPKGETDLEFWIAENVDDVDFSEYEPKYGLMGGREYYGSGYVPITDENGERKDPAHCVVYTITSYPDYSSGKSHITRITITDPNVKVYGLTLNSSKDEIKSTMVSNGFKLKEYANSNGLMFEKGKFSIRFSEKSISISANVTNILGIQF